MYTNIITLYNRNKHKLIILKNKLIRKEIRFVATRGGELWEGKLYEGNQKYKLPVVRNKYWVGQKFILTFP